MEFAHVSPDSKNISMQLLLSWIWNYTGWLFPKKETYNNDIQGIFHENIFQVSHHKHHIVSGEAALVNDNT